jgi:hypothetical protein
MENEYAKFGLPDDAANQPVQPNQPSQPHARGWFSRNLWWLLPAVFLALVSPCCCCGGIFWWVVGSLKSSEPYRMALERVRTDRDVIGQLGEPVAEAGWMPTGNFSYHTDNGVTSGRANFDFSVSGPKGTARVHAEAVCRNGKWVFRILEVTPASGGRTISLTVDEKPGKAEEEDGEE